jgi:hypothetical protein
MWSLQLPSAIQAASQARGNPRAPSLLVTYRQIQGGFLMRSVRRHLCKFWTVDVWQMPSPRPSSISQPNLACQRGG